MSTDTVTVVLPDDSWLDRVGEVPGARFVAWDLTGEVPDEARDARMVVPPYPTPMERLDRIGDLPSVEVVQVLMAGYDGVVDVIGDQLTLCNAHGVHDAATAEHAVGLMLSSLRAYPEFVRAQDEGRWIKVGMQPGLADRRVLLVGYGSIGQAIVRRLLPFEVTVTAVASRARDGDELVEHVHGVDELSDLLPEHDVVCVITPLTDTTAGLIDADVLAAMPDGALLVNVARGKVADTDALVDACSTGRILAAVDVTDPEPLPDDHPLFSTPGVFVAPHVGGQTQAFFPRAASLIRAQVGRLLAGEELDCVVHRPS